MRPKSVVDCVEGVSAERIPDLLPSLDACPEEMDTVSELPASAYQLRHLGKARPRRAKTRAPSRAAAPGEHESQLDSGLDVFFQPARSLPSSPLTSPDSESRSGAVKRGISSVFSKLAAERVARSREDRDGRPVTGRKSTDAGDSDSSAGSGSADSFLNHLLTPPVAPTGGEDGAEPALRRPAGLAGADLLAEMKKKQEKRASLTPKHTPEELDERSAALSPLQGVKGRPGGLRSPRAAEDDLTGPASISPKPALTSRLSKQSSPLPGLYRPPPPLGPKPRPKSMGGRATDTRCLSGGNTSGDESVMVTSPADGEQSSTLQDGHQAADAGDASGQPTSPDGSGAPSLERQPKRLTPAELESLLESSVDGPLSLSGISVASADSSASSAALPSVAVPTLILEQAYSLEDVINV